MNTYGSPKAKYKFAATMALRANIISAQVIPGKMVLVDTGKVYFDVKEGDYAEQFAIQVMTNSKEAVQLYDHIKTLI